MTKKEYEAYIKELKERGYKLVDNRYGNRLYYYKVIEYREDKYGDNRAVCQLIFYLYETQGLRPNEFFYSIEPHVDVSRNIDERLIFNICHPKRSIDECERIAIEFMEWVDSNIKEPHEDD